MNYISAQGSWTKKFPVTHRRVNLLVSQLKLTTDWMRPTFIRERNLLCSVYQLNVNLM
jgi:hypothetical protein